MTRLTDIWTSRRNSDDLQKFFDRYLKGIDSGWEDSPSVRLSLISFNGTDVVERPEPEVSPAISVESIGVLSSAHSGCSIHWRDNSSRLFTSTVAP